MVQYGVVWTIIFILLLSPVSISGESEDDVVMERYANYTLGDYLKWEVNATGFVETVGRASDLGEYLRYENVTSSAATKDVVLKETISSGGADFDCVMLRYTYDLSFNILYRDVNKTAFYHITILTKEWYDITEMFVVKSEINEDLTVEYRVDGEAHRYEARSLSTGMFSNYQNSVHFPHYSGQSGTVTADVHIEYSNREREDSSRWDHNSGTDDHDMRMHVNILDNVHLTTRAGSFDCIVRKDRDAGDSAYSLSMYSVEGIPIAMEEYDKNGDIQYSYILTSYSVTDPNPGVRNESDGQMNVGIIVVIFIVITCLGILGWMMKTEPATEHPLQTDKIQLEKDTLGDNSLSAPPGPGDELHPSFSEDPTIESDNSPAFTDSSSLRNGDSASYSFQYDGSDAEDERSE